MFHLKNGLESNGGKYSRPRAVFPPYGVQQCSDCHVHLTASAFQPRQSSNRLKPDRSSGISGYNLCGER